VIKSTDYKARQPGSNYAMLLVDKVQNLYTCSYEVHCIIYEALDTHNVLVFIGVQF
jgi:hypothetical protein